MSTTPPSPTWRECLEISKGEMCRRNDSPLIPDLLKGHPKVSLIRGVSGRSLIAKVAIPAFTEVLSDTAIAWYPPTCNTVGASIPGMCDFAPSQTRESVERLLLELCPYAEASGCPEANEISDKTSLTRGEAYAKIANLNALGALVDEDAPSEYRRVPLLCPLVAMIQHHCAPNCSYESFYSKSAGAPGIRVFSECDIGEGEEISISYIPRHLPTSARQTQLSTVYGFTCTCTRCVSCVEDTVVYRCTECQNGGIAEGGEEGVTAPCSQCGSKRKGEMGMAERERFLTSSPLQSGDAAARARLLLSSSTSPLHTDDQGCFSALYACLGALWQDCSDAALKCTAAAAVCDSAAVSRVGRGPAYTCDALLIAGHFHALAAATENQAKKAQLLEKAKEYYTRASTLYRAMYGGTDPRVGISQSLAAAPPRSSSAAESAERKRLEATSNWCSLYSLSQSKLLRWMKAVPRREGGGVDALAMRELIAASRR